MSKTLHIKSTGQHIVDLTDTQWNDLQRLLVKERPDDRDFFVDATTLGYLEANGCNADLVQALFRALEHKRSAYRSTPSEPDAERDPDDGIDVEWRETDE